MLKRIIFIFLIFQILITTQFVSAQIISNITELGHIQYSAAGGEDFICGDVWGFSKDGREYAIIALTEQGVSIVDVTDPANPVETSFITIPGGGGRLYHCKYYNGYMYAVMRPGPLQIIDARDPANAQVVLEYDTNINEIYSIFIADSIAHLTDVESPDANIKHIFLDISDPLNPVELGTWHRIYHHVYARNDTMIGFVLNGEVDIVDISDPQNPVWEKNFETGASCHSGWLNDDGAILTTDHETAGGHLKLWDISQSGDPILLGEFETASNNEGETAIHHSRWYDDLIYMSYWQDGFRLADASDPANPFQIAAYDTIDPNQSTMFRGTWGTYPFLPSRNILTSDPKRGLFILDYPDDGPGLRHDPLEILAPDSEQIRATLTHIKGAGVNTNNSKIFWRTNMNSNWQSTPLQFSGSADQYFFELNLSGSETRLDYYIKAEGNNGQLTRVPGLAPYLDFQRIHFNLNGSDGFEDIYISEVSDAGSEETEFLEIHNIGSQDVDLDTFKLVQFAPGTDANINNSEIVFDFGEDEMRTSSTIVPAQGFLIVARGAAQNTFETEWQALGSNTNYNSGNSSLQFGDSDQKRWMLLAAGNFDKADGTIIDDSDALIGGSGNRSYQASPGNWQTDSYGNATPGALDQDQSLPVELTTFKASAGNGRALIEWQTQSELQNLGFILLRGENESGVYQTISSYKTNANLKGLGTSAQGKAYAFYDEGLQNGNTYWYKIKDVDINGNSKVHGPVSVTPAMNKVIDDDFTDLPTDFVLSPNYPNPFNNATRFSIDIRNFEGGSQLPVVVNVYDILGRTIRTIFRGSLTSGRHVFNWDGRDNRGNSVQSAIYILKANAGDWNKTRKMVFIK